MLVNPAQINEITRVIIGCAIRVHRALGPGLLESAYAVCLAIELAHANTRYATRVPVPLIYRGIRTEVAYWLDFLVDDRVIVELKCVGALAPIHTAQLLTYLRLTGKPAGLLINFNVPILKEGIKRVLNTKE
jgi:GxxExxY protein